jgi:hypothetical protein
MRTMTATPAQRTPEGWRDAARDLMFLRVLRARLWRDQGGEEWKTDDIIRDEIVAELREEIRQGRWDRCGSDRLDESNKETMMAAYQRAIDEALAMPFEDLYWDYEAGL